MSIAAMKYVWDKSVSTENSRLVLLAIADMANEIGDAFPGIEKLAQRSRISERTAQRMIHQLELLGEVQVFPNVGYKTDSGWTNLYRIVMDDVKQGKVYNCKGEEVSPRQIKEVTTVTPLEIDKEIYDTLPQGVTAVTPNPPDSNTKTMSTLSAAGFAAAFTAIEQIKSDEVQKATVSTEATVVATMTTTPLPLQLSPESNMPIPFRKIVSISPESGDVEVVEEGAKNKTKKGRPRKEGVTPAECINPMKNAIVKAFNWNWKTMSKGESGTVYTAAKQLCEVNFPVNEIQDLYDFCAEKFTDFKPTALPMHQSDYRKEHKPKDSKPHPALADSKPVVPIGIRRIIESGRAAEYDINPAEYGYAT